MGGKRLRALGANRFGSDYAMSYKEIGEKLGITARKAQTIAETAMAKLRRNPEIWRGLRELVQLRRKLEDERIYLHETGYQGVKRDTLDK